VPADVDRLAIKHGLDFVVRKFGMERCICAMAAYSISNRYTLSAIFGTDIYAPKRRNMRRRQISDMLVCYLQYK